MILDWFLAHKKYTAIKDIEISGEICIRSANQITILCHVKFPDFDNSTVVMSENKEE